VQLQGRASYFGPTQNMDAATETTTELLGLTEKLLRRYAREIDADNLTVRCLVMSEFFLAAYSVQPDLTVYRILHLDIEQNISQLFAATWRCGTGISDLQLYRDGPWEETFRKIGTEVLSR
jgi:hypothetical protein